ncbi:hypothetical protein KAM329_012890 [Aeromonas caviae]|nr:hypothetical protein KAM329_012890 [Aeromonas caviae]
MATLMAGWAGFTSQAEWRREGAARQHTLVWDGMRCGIKGGDRGQEALMLHAWPDRTTGGRAPHREAHLAGWGRWGRGRNGGGQKPERACWSGRVPDSGGGTQCRVVHS